MISLKYLAEACRTAYHEATVDAGNSQAFCELHDGIPVIAIRGSDSGRDWIRNLDARLEYDWTLGYVHAGFSRAAGELRDFPAFATWCSAYLSPRRPLVLTGHSQGAAVAALLGHWLANDKAVSQVHLATFGSPRVLSNEAAKCYTDVLQVSRVVHRDDLVPHLPSWRYTHVGTPIYLNTSAAGRAVRTLPAIVSEHLAKGGLLGWWERGWEDHHISNYVDFASDEEWLYA